MINQHEIEWILDRFENFSSITFQSKTNYLLVFHETIATVTKKGKDFTCSKTHDYASFWFGEQKLNIEN
jgi:hypothetical protein